MAVKIRLKRIGRRNRPFYRMCVFDSRTRRDGRPIEELGSYDPRGATIEGKVSLDLPRAHYWLTVGAQPSETCASLLRKMGVRKDGPAPEPAPVAEAVVAADEAPVEAAAAATSETSEE
ncbi:MAG: small subunit ribosomal protein S16 [Pseudohongiellaceae bacterium]|jgi:small subunit ribosomal protein S16